MSGGDLALFDMCQDLLRAAHGIWSYVGQRKRNVENAHGYTRADWMYEALLPFSQPGKSAMLFYFRRQQSSVHSIATK